LIGLGIRVGLSGPSIKKMGEIGRDGKPGRGEGQSSKGKVQGEGRGSGLAFTSPMPGTTPPGETALLPMGNPHVRLRLSRSIDLLPDEAATAWSANSWPIVKEHATLSAVASVDHGVEVECRKGHVNRAADRGCVSRLVRFLDLTLRLDLPFLKRR
jgi:hypothetical protein